MQDSPKAVWSIPYTSVAFFPSLKQNFIAYRSSKVSSCPDCNFKIHQLWQSGFSRVYSNSCCSCSFEREIIKIGQSSHKMYSNNIVNSQESTTILNAWTKKVWKLIECITNKGKSFFTMSASIHTLTPFSPPIVTGNLTELMAFTSICWSSCALQGDTLAPYLFIICLNYVLRMSIDLIKENSFKLAKERSRRYPAQTMYRCGVHQWHSASSKFTYPSWIFASLEQAVGGIDLHVKTEYMYFNQRGNISTLKGSPLKLVDKFTYLGSSNSSTENDINMQLAKA